MTSHEYLLEQHENAFRGDLSSNNDSHQYDTTIDAPTFEKLQKEKMKPQQAQIIATAISSVKNGLQSLRIELHDEINTLRAEMHSEFNALRSEINARFAKNEHAIETLQKDVKDMKVDIKELKSDGKLAKVLLIGMSTAVIAEIISRFFGG